MDFWLSQRSEILSFSLIVIEEPSENLSTTFFAHYIEPIESM
jgi:hypothetical protein